ncbi:hypothetical protein DWG18_11240 [Lysobacter sp. TY2-98]|uniref:hypothetical protein n=1 Tax=Lysobacter sp. TY2-98 TaxID=2290922 RepID=UPI000E201015|nr:hypothetical protein [Lysobacter sp. TY2-98]AXK72795.1 hypothetical protein DWG18_11240 [Lysobacter sp. TY2-98]
MTFDLDSLRNALADVPVVAWCAVIAVLLLQRVARRFGLWLYAAFALPGTLAHELAHYIVALLLAARPQVPRLWPERTPTGWRLGSVAFRAPWWRAGPIALAPLLLLPGAVAWIVMFLADARGAWIAVHAWIAGTLFGAAMPSRADVRIAAPTLAVLALIAAAVVAVRITV